MSASLPVRSLLAATAAMLLLSACSTAYYTGDTISGPAQRMKRDADGNLHDPLLDAPNRSLMTRLDIGEDLESDSHVGFPVTVQVRKLF